MPQRESLNAASSGFPFGGSIAGFPGPAGPVEGEPGSAYWTGDLAEQPIPGWDNAWIDLGGEG
jgi:hypothetical protein